jgi:hypothetical protein
MDYELYKHGPLQIYNLYYVSAIIAVAAKGINRSIFLIV